MYNSPLQYCSECKQYVELDQTQTECAQQHGCKIGRCPLAHLFTDAQRPESETPADAGTASRLR
jgi:hypothetical protein